MIRDSQTQPGEQQLAVAGFIEVQRRLDRVELLPRLLSIQPVKDCLLYTSDAADD